MIVKKCQFAIINKGNNYNFIAYANSMVIH